MIPRRHLLALLSLPPVLAGCGWEPLYADRESASASADLQSIKVAPISERIGQRLEMGLRKSFNPDGAATPTKYVLQVTLNTSVSDLGIQSQGLGTRGEVQVYANYQLSDTAGHVVQNSSVHANDSFDIQANGYSTVVAQDDAYVRSIEEIRREIVMRMNLFMQHKAMAAS
jgi:LPS-assembly lipoprotein